MLNEVLTYILPSFSRYGVAENIVPFGNGLINSTWKIRAGNHDFILQRINDEVFKEPQIIDQNLKLIQQHLHQYYPNYIFAAPLPNNLHLTLTFVPNHGYFRLMPFINGSHTKEELTDPQFAWEAAAQFASFTAMLSNIDTSSMKESIPFFHNLPLRFHQFEQALLQAPSNLLLLAQDQINTLQSLQYIAINNNRIMLNPAFKKRPMHHDTKISNVLFNQNNIGICVIDLDTVMPGYFFSDVGDMMRTYLCSVNEESTEWGLIQIRNEYYAAIVNGYCSQMGIYLSETEKQHFFDAGCFMIYMQALRFLTDYLNSDIYYGAAYPLHNLNRAKHHTILLQQLLKKEKILKNSLY
ncbi:MAG: aminoglycoside phosphotransferase family protein [Ferruginibacter sp.]